MTSMEHLIQRARVLHEALPYIRRFYGRTLVIKYGGHAMVDPELRSGFARDIVLLKYVGMHPVIVHGGGPQINEMLDRLKIKSHFIDGLRVTDAETMEVVEMVLGGKINKDIVSMISQSGGRAVGLTGKDGDLILAEKIQPESDDKPDLGRVARIKSVNPEIIQVLDAQGFIPVVAPVGVDRNGDTYNINADIMAQHMAIALRAQKLILMTDVDGVKDSDGNTVSVLDRRIARDLTQGGIIKGGMIPKVHCALDAMDGGVEQVHIINGTVPHAVLLELFTDEGIGTMFEPILAYSDEA